MIKLKHLLSSEYLVLYLSVVYFLLLWPFTPGLASPQNMANFFSNMLPLAVAAIGQTLVLVTAGIDLSATAIIALSSITGAYLMSSDSSLLPDSTLVVPIGIMAMLSVGAALGFINGTAVSRLRMPPFMVTLAAMIFFSGFAVWMTQSGNIYNLPPAFNQIGQGSLLFIPFALLIVLAVGIIAHVTLSKTVLGHRLYAVGHNLRAATVSGVPVNRTITLAYIGSGICAAVSSIIYTARLETGSPVLGEGVLLDIVAAAVIGGSSLFGGKGKVLWTVFGVLFITLIDNSLNLLGLSYFAVLTVKGLIILLAALLDAARLRWSQ
ncbi:MAG: ABC transporter permease [Acidobacteriota bacterium]